MKTSTAALVLVFCLALCANLAIAETASIDLALARQYFDELQSLSEQDSGTLWGVPLYGPTMFVDPATRLIVANRPDPKGQFKANSGVFTGTLESNVNVSNTATELSGMMWTMVNWNAISDSDPSERAKLLLHESWHRVQNELGIPAVTTSNVHLDEKDGRIYLLLEFRALSRALLATKQSARNEAIGDALLFRRYRQSRAPQNNEDAFERHEGMAEYTGLKLCGLPDSLCTRVAALKLQRGESNDGLANSFAYLTGPALGLLLDDLSSRWREQLRRGISLPTLLAEATGWKSPLDLARFQSAVDLAGQKYDAARLIADETERSQEQEQTVESFRQRLLTNGRLLIANNNLNFSFNPMEKLVAFDSTGVIYKTMRLTGDFGVLEVSNGILRTNNWQFFVAVAPDQFVGDSLVWEGYQLKLLPEWQVVSSGQGRFVIERK